MVTLLRCAGSFYFFFPQFLLSEERYFRRRQTRSTINHNFLHESANMQALLRTTSRAVGRAGAASAAPPMAPFGGMLSVRGIGQVGVPENYGQIKDGPGTEFLGTPKNHREVRAMKKRREGGRGKGSGDLYDGDTQHHAGNVVPPL